MSDRRGFLRLGMAAAACLAASGRLFAKSAADFDDNLIVFLADVHAGAGEKCKVARKTFAATVAEILGMDPLPRNVIVFGDVAYKYGAGEDYDSSRPLFRKLEDAGIAVTIGMGNHDRRSEYAKRWPEAAAKSLVPGRYVPLVETPNVGFLMLDTLQGADDRPATDTGPQGGALSKDEQSFLKGFLSGRSKPVVVCAHHPCGDLWCCGERLDALLCSSPAFAGYIHGHFHRWVLEKEREVCLPSASAWGDVGYAVCRCRSDRAEMECGLKGYMIPSPSGDPLMMTPAHRGTHTAVFKFNPGFRA